LLLVLVILIWGINYVVGRCLSSPVVFGYVHITGVLFGFLRYLVAALTMGTLLLSRRQGLSAIRLELRPHRRPLALSIVASSIFVLSAHQSQAYVSSGTTSVIVNFCPVLVLAYGIWRLKEKTTTLGALGFGLGACGGTLFLLNSRLSVGGQDIGLGLVLALIAMVAWAAYTVTLHHLGGADRAAVLGVQHAVSTLLITPFLGFYLLSSPLKFVPDAWSALGIFFSGAISSGLAYILYFQAIGSLGARRAASFLFLVPLVSLLGDLTLGELPRWTALAGGLVALVGVALIKVEGAQVRRPG
jgi:drug/metabolite transporter (DMT)-like permease